MSTTILASACMFLIVTAPVTAGTNATSAIGKGGAESIARAKIGMVIHAAKMAGTAITAEVNAGMAGVAAADMMARMMIQPAMTAKEAGAIDAVSVAVTVETIEEVA